MICFSVKDGYNQKEIRIRTPQGYKLTVAAYLSTSTTGLTFPSSSTSANVSPSPTSSGTPAPTETNAVLILTTPTGYLNVRAGPSLSADEVGQVNPGKTYPLISEESGWYEISIDDGTTGWISTQYAEKNKR